MGGNADDDAFIASEDEEEEVANEGPAAKRFRGAHAKKKDSSKSKSSSKSSSAPAPSAAEAMQAAQGAGYASTHPPASASTGKKRSREPSSSLDDLAAQIQGNANRRQ